MTPNRSRTAADKTKGGEVLYSLAELQASAEEERRTSALSREKVDPLEIDVMFKGRLARRRVPASLRSPGLKKLISLTHPPIPKENQRYIEEAARTGTVSGLEKAIGQELIARKQAGDIWGSHIGYAYVNPLESIVTPEALTLVPEEIARKAGILPLYVIDQVLTYATDKPADTDLARRLANIIGHKVSPVFAFPSEIQDALNIHYASRDEISISIKEFEKQHGLLQEMLSEAEVASAAESRPITKIVDSLLHWAIRERASDIHLEPMEASTRVRFRVDGRLREYISLSKSLHPAITSRIKVLTNVNIAESRFPQDGRFGMPLGSGKAEFRVNFLPSRHGIKTVIRILGSTGRKKLITLDEMLVSQSILRSWRRVIRNPNGIVFVTGPTGSGKTTTLYATLQELNRPDINISTIEDPIEIDLPGATQSQVNHFIDLNFPILLRALLRQDPDVILVGEIRDKETAKIATEAALTGHLVFATLHTNNAIQATTRLLEIGIEPYMVAPSINAILAQRLAARLIDETKEAYQPPPEVLKTFFHDAEGSEAVFYRPGPGLSDPALGYKGRVALHELVVVSDEIRSLISAHAGTHQLNLAARAMGYRPLRYDGLRKCLLGLTSLEEIERVTPMEWKAVTL